MAPNAGIISAEREISHEENVILLQPRSHDYSVKGSSPCSCEPPRICCFSVVAFPLFIIIPFFACLFICLFFLNEKGSC